jgi:hypothetical protein
VRLETSEGRTETTSYEQCSHNGDVSTILVELLRLRKSWTMRTNNDRSAVGEGLRMFRLANAQSGHRDYSRASRMQNLRLRLPKTRPDNDYTLRVCRFVRPGHQDFGHTLDSFAKIASMIPFLLPTTPTSRSATEIEFH